MKYDDDDDANEVIISLREALEDYLAEENDFVLQEQSPTGEHFIGKTFSKTLKGKHLTFSFISRQKTFNSI